MEYKIYIPSRRSRFCGITLGDRKIHVTTSFFRVLGSQHVTISYSMPGGLIMVSPSPDNEHSHRVFTTSQGAHVISAALGRIVPPGRYIYQTKDGDGFILKPEKVVDKNTVQ